jgi:hypothetical protein
MTKNSPCLDVTFSITGFSDEKQSQEFLDLYQFALNGRVCVGWGDIEYDDPQYDEEGDNIYPIYDESDRSDHRWFPLAQMLATAGCYDIYATDGEHGSIILLCRTPDVNGELVLDESERTADLTVDIQ